MDAMAVSQAPEGSSMQIQQQPAQIDVSGGGSMNVASESQAPPPSVPVPVPRPPVILAPSQRLKQVTVCCPIVYGSVAFHLGKKADDAHTHEWTVYVRGAGGEDISYFVSKIVFTLHPSFEPNTRELTQFPFEVTEMGWGEFEVKIAIHFHDPAETPVETMHPLKLYPDPNAPVNAKLPVVSERYDEIVFTDPHESYFKKLVEGQRAPVPPHELQEHFLNFADQAASDIQKLSAARQYIHSEMLAVKEKITNSDLKIKSIQALRS